MISADKIIRSRSALGRRQQLLKLGFKRRQFQLGRAIRRENRRLGLFNTLNIDSLVFRQRLGFKPIQLPPLVILPCMQSRARRGHDVSHGSKRHQCTGRD